jgi:hypothetical protein
MSRWLLAILFLSQVSFAGLSPFVTIEGKVIKKTTESLYLEIDKKKVRIPLRYLPEDSDFATGDQVAIELERAHHDEILELHEQKK